MGLELVELILAVEDRFSIRINDRQASRVVTAQDLYGLVFERVKSRFPPPRAVEVESNARAVPVLNYAHKGNLTGALQAEDVWPIVRELIARTLRVPVDRVYPHSRLVEDLGA